MGGAIKDTLLDTAMCGFIKGSEIHGMTIGWKTMEQMIFLMWTVTHGNSGARNIDQPPMRAPTKNSATQRGKLNKHVVATIKVATLSLNVFIPAA